MNVLIILAVAAVALLLSSRYYSRYIARIVGEDTSRPTPAVAVNDGRDYVPSPTPVVFGHHFAAIAGAGPIVGPLIAVIYGWLPALLWVIIGGVLIGAVHDYLAIFMSMREGGHSIATIVRRLMGKWTFLAMVLFLVVMLTLVCATFLNLSARALVSALPVDRIGFDTNQTLLKLAEIKGKQHVMIGGIASMSVAVITVFAPLIGWMYIKRKINVWVCSIVSLAVCVISVIVGLYFPITLPQSVDLLSWTGAGSLVVSGEEGWKLLLAAYVMIAAGLPVWMFLQSRDFINAHILYIGMTALLITLIVAAIVAPVHAPQNVDSQDAASARVLGDPIPAVSLDSGEKTLGFFWPALFITIACGAVSGFHSLCAGGTTCKQITSERAARKVGYNAMLLETFVAVCVIATLMIGASKHDYLMDLYPKTINMDQSPNQVLGFAAAVGVSAQIAWGIPVAFGALIGMLLLEGFLITTLDAAVRLMRYLLEEIWRTIFERYDVYASAMTERRKTDHVAAEHIMADGVPAEIETDDEDRVVENAIPTHGLARWSLKFLQHYWVNSGLAIGLTLLFAFTGGADVLWGIFATSNQLLAAMVLSLAALWLLRQGRKSWFAFIPAVFMLATTVASLIMLLQKYLAAPGKNMPLLIADIIIMIITVFLLVSGGLAARKFLIERRAKVAAEGQK